ncbi:MAG: TIGR03617 family F420-dependent LLM class oxidoreductase [Acidimicrobiales bacterium]
MTTEITLGTSIAVAFARNPMLLANIGYDLNAASNGRFVLGLGSQIKPHITKRFSMEWSKPAARMREMVQAIHAIWDCWEEGSKLDFHGEFYTHSIMTPFFNPGPNPGGKARIFISAVGPLMTQVAGEVCDGIFCHAFTTPEFLADVTIPNIAAGQAKSGRSGDDFEVCLGSFIVTGSTEAEMAASNFAARKQIAFYGSTPAYRPVLEHHGWGEVQDELNTMSKLGQRDAMAYVITDDILHAFATVAEPDDIAGKLMARYGAHVSRLSLYSLGGPSEAPLVAKILSDLSSLQGTL